MGCLGPAIGLSLACLGLVMWLLGSVLGDLGLFWDCLGPVLDWGCLEPVFDCPQLSWTSHGPAMACLGLSGACLGPVLGWLAPDLGCLGRVWGVSGAVLDMSWACLGLSWASTWACIGASWASPGTSRACLETSQSQNPNLDNSFTFSLFFCHYFGLVSGSEYPRYTSN